MDYGFAASLRVAGSRFTVAGFGWRGLGVFGRRSYERALGGGLSWVFGVMGHFMRVQRPRGHLVLGFGLGLGFFGFGWGGAWGWRDPGMRLAWARLSRGGARDPPCLRAGGALGGSVLVVTTYFWKTLDKSLHWGLLALSTRDTAACPGKPFRSKLQPFEEELYELLARGTSYRKIAEILNERHSLGISHNAVHSFVKASSRRHRLRPRFYDGLDADLRDGLIKQIVALWTHDSTAIEGNTLTLGETAQVLELGLTISGKALKDHEEVYGHARAIELIRQLDEGEALDEERLVRTPPRHHAAKPD